ncbi:MAG: hypothetical protein ABJA18_09025 [bacterium]
MMKYRDLKSIAHNFSHSFVSLMNYVDDGYVIDDLLQVARDANGERVSIQWIPDAPPPSFLPPRVLKSIFDRNTWLPLTLLTLALTSPLSGNSERIFI